MERIAKRNPVFERLNIFMGCSMAVVHGRKHTQITQQGHQKKDMIDIQLSNSNKTADCEGCSLHTQAKKTLSV